MKRGTQYKENDNVATVLEDVEIGDVVFTGRSQITASQAVPQYHKIALRELKPGDAVMKYGESIGIATAPIAAGTHVHVHNLDSNRGRGDRP